LRSGQKVSKIWDHGIEYRALDTPQLDKYWTLLEGNVTSREE
jgi:hypothetical protein